jgi:hypothetical protein
VENGELRFSGRGGRWRAAHFINRSRGVTESDSPQGASANVLHRPHTRPGKFSAGCFKVRYYVFNNPRKIRVQLHRIITVDT